MGTCAQACCMQTCQPNISSSARLCCLLLHQLVLGNCFNMPSEITSLGRSFGPGTSPSQRSCPAEKTSLDIQDRTNDGTILEDFGEATQLSQGTYGKWHVHQECVVLPRRISMNPEVVSGSQRICSKSAD